MAANTSESNGRAYLQLLCVGGISSHFPDRLGAPENQGKAGQLASYAANIHTLQRVKVKLPDLNGCSKPGIPGAEREEPVMTVLKEKVTLNLQNPLNIFHPSPGFANRRISRESYRSSSRFLLVRKISHALEPVY